MSRRKHAWHALDYAKETNGDVVQAQSAVEEATIEDFTDTVFERWETLEQIVALNPDVKIGYELAIRELRETFFNYGWAQHER